jgi:superfamily II DNA or RNA helicase
MDSGARLLVPHLKDVIERKGRVRFLTGDYLGVTEPNALLRLLDLGEGLSLRVFESEGLSFHPKAYILRGNKGEGVAFIGSSNLSNAALYAGVEWNYRIITSAASPGFRDVLKAFDDLFEHPRTREVDAEWVRGYRDRRVPVPIRVGIRPEPVPPPPPPHPIQREALQALEETRRNGLAAGMVVLATGLGKTWLSAFDSDRPEFQRVLFVAHRDEILTQAMQTFRRIRPGAALGKYTGTERAPNAEVLFASIQTLGRQHHLDRFDRDEFDYIIVDEFHHAAAATYRRLIDYFRAAFLLGLTATPERTDGGDLLALCGENLVYRCDLVEGIREGLLCPFAYYGVPDNVDYRNIPWRNNRFDEQELTAAVATRDRALNALEQLRAKGGTRTLAFCVSQRHADFMGTFFNDNGLRAVAVHSGETSAPRTHSLELLEAGDLDVVCAVDMFNEGVDLPHVDTILMLRPTESRILWLQQFGRGLRLQEGKKLKVIDYIGNHRSFLVKPRALLQLGSSDQELRVALEQLEDGTFDLPPGCSVTYELEAKDIIRSLLRRPGEGDALRTYYQDFKEREGIRPLAIDTYNDSYNPRAARAAHGSWLGLVDFMGDLSPPEHEVRTRHGAFLDTLEVTEMTRSYKMLVLLAMLSEGQLPGSIDIDQLGVAVARIARRSPVLERELHEGLADQKAMQSLLESNPIAAWVGGRGTGGQSYFRYEGRIFTSQLRAEGEEAEALRGLIREIAEWRLAEYLRRAAAGQEQDRFYCRVSHSGNRPIIFLPSRASTPGIPEGWTEILLNNEPRMANFAKVAVNVVSLAREGENLLPDILRDWFGPDAGLPGTRHQVVFDRTQGGLSLRPDVPLPSSGPDLWRSYMRAEIPPLFGLQFVKSVWEQGMVMLDRKVVLLVTLEKERMQEEHRYADRFLSPAEFYWQSQNRTTQAGKHGQLMKNHKEMGTEVHLFVRRSGLLDGKAAPFVYCGQLDFERWEGERPITVWWKLRSPLPPRLSHAMGLRAPTAS